MEKLDEDSGIRTRVHCNPAYGMVLLNDLISIEGFKYYLLVKFYGSWWSLGASRDKLASHLTSQTTDTFSMLISS